MKKLSLILAFLAACATTTFADISLPAKVEVGKPYSINHSFFSETEANKIQRNIVNLYENDYWIVFSDRYENYTYFDPNLSSSICDTLDLGEPLIVAKVKGRFALVFQQTIEDSRFPDINHSIAKSRGWIPLDNLVLWDKCPRCDQNNSLNRALIVPNFDCYDLFSDDFQYKLFWSPNNQDKHFRLRCGQIFYIIKEDGNGETGACWDSMGVIKQCQDLHFRAGGQD